MDTAGYHEGEELTPARLRRPRLDVMTGLPLGASLSALFVLLAIGAVATTFGDDPVPLFNGVSGLLRAVSDEGRLMWPSASIVVEATVPVAASLTYGALTPLLGARYLGERPASSAAIAALARAWRPLTLLGLGRALAGGAVVVIVHLALQPLVGGAQAYLLGSGVALALSMATWLAEPAVVLEGLSPVAAVRRSSELFNRRPIHATAAFVVAGLFSVALGIVLGLPLLQVEELLGDSVAGVGGRLTAIAQGLPVPLTTLVLAGAGTLLALDRRVEAGELRRSQLRQEVVAATDPSTS